MSRSLGALAITALAGASGFAPLAAQNAPPAPSLAPVGKTEGLRNPESAKYDAGLDLYFVSEVNGNPSQKDNNGAIRVVSPAGKLRPAPLAEGGKKGVTLNAPKGMALVGDTLWVADIDAVRGFNRRTGAAVATIDLMPQHAVFLNDITAGPDGTLYVTDTGIVIDPTGKPTHPGPDRVFKIAGRTVSVALEGDQLARPNGITWDKGNKRLIIVPFGGDTILAWHPGDATPTALATGPGQFDGVEVLADGRILVTSWAASSVEEVRDGRTVTVAKDIKSPADIGVDTKRNRLAVPQLTEGRVVYLQLR